MIPFLTELPPGELRERRALVRVDYNVPLTDGGEVADAWRVEASLPTLEHLVERASVSVLLSHLGRPGGAPDPDLSLRPVVPVLERGLGREVRFLEEPDGDAAVAATREAEPGSVLLAENVRFLPGETENDPALAGALARLGDLYVNDAFGACHRSHASTVGVARLLRPAVAGLLVERELAALDRVRTDAERPYVVLFGGAKVADKVGLLRGLAERADRLLVGGAMANTFLRAGGLETGRSLVEEDALEAAREVAAAAGDRLLLPEDLVVAPSPEAGEEARSVDADAVPAGAMALDVGPRTRRRFAGVVREAATVFWNGPMGLFEREAFAAGTRELATAAGEAAADGAFVVVGGGDSARAVRQAGVADTLSHVSTGGGAALKYLEAGRLPALEVLEREEP